LRCWLSLPLASCSFGGGNNAQAWTSRRHCSEQKVRGPISIPKVSCLHLKLRRKRMLALRSWGLEALKNCYLEVRKNCHLEVRKNLMPIQSRELLRRVENISLRRCHWQASHVLKDPVGIKRCASLCSTGRVLRCARAVVVVEKNCNAAAQKK
jgi:hypothetical protein